jgi:sec-independent protein translocase protein TatA
MFTGLESPAHLLFVLLVVLLLFGAKRVPELGRGLGEGLREFREGMKAGSEPGEDSRQSTAARRISARPKQEEDREEG